MATEVDLTPDASEPDILTPETAPYDPAPEREKLRGYLATLLVGLLVGVVVMAFLTLWFQWTTFEELKGLLDLIVSPVVGLVGAVTGFYFGEKRSRSR